MLEQLVIIVAVAWFALRMMLAGIIGWAVDQFSGGIDSAFSWVKDFVHRVVGAVEDALTSLIWNIADGLQSVIGWVWDSAQALVHDLGNVLSWWVGALGAIVRAVDAFAHWVEQEALDGIRWVGSALGSAIQAAADALWRAITDLTSWVNDHVLAPLERAVMDVVDYIGNTLTHWINGLISDIWCFIKDLAANVGHTATQVFNTLISPIATAMDVVYKAMKWLVWMAEHPFGWFDDMVHQFFDHRGEWLFGVFAKSVQDNFATVDEWLTKFFG